ncbi:hypothetical protein C0995_010874 [Termitomyces sp. Mi166|nr:hypothetical protein C0995_010874 [Termitomyces sp. Mi166\
MNDVKDVKSNKQSNTLIGKLKAGMKVPTRTPKAHTNHTVPTKGFKDHMKSCFAHMRDSGVPKSERRTSVAYAFALLNANDEEARLMEIDFDDAEETQVAMAASDRSLPEVTSDPENDQHNVIVATSTSGRDVNISWTRPTDPVSPSDSSDSCDLASLESNVVSSKSEDQDSYPITWTDGVSTHTIHIRNGIRFHYTVGPPLPPQADGTNSTQPERPFNHLPQEPRSHPHGLRRENAFCHKSHYEIFWYPGFGDYNEPPTTVEEALPAHYRRPRNESTSTSVATSSSCTNLHTSSNDQAVISATMPVGTSCASTVSSVSRKRSRDNDNSDDVDDGAPPRRRRRSSGAHPISSSVV